MVLFSPSGCMSIPLPAASSHPLAYAKVWPWAMALRMSSSHKVVSRHISSNVIASGDHHTSSALQLWLRLRVPASFSRSRATLATALLAAAAGVLSSQLYTFRGTETTELQLGTHAAAFRRAVRVAAWGVGSVAEYKWLQAQSGDFEDGLRLEAMHSRRASQLANVLQVNGGIYIKVGQLASSLSAVPLVYRQELEALQDSVSPHPPNEIKSVLESELEASLPEVFSFLDPEPTAAASLAQVHKAQLLNGRIVAVKVQYPGLEIAVSDDLTVLRVLAAAAARAFPSIRLGWLVECLADSLEAEMDFRVEAQHAKTLRQHFLAASRGHRYAVPEVVEELSSQRVLTMEWIDGCKITDKACLESQRIRPHQVAHELLHMFADLTFRAGYLHGDPHPGNILVRKRSGGWNFLAPLWPSCDFEIVMLDHGVHLQLGEDMRSGLSQLWCHIISGNIRAATEVGAQVAGSRVGIFLPMVMQPGEVKKETRTRIREANGFQNSEDVARMVEETVTPLLTQTLKAGAVVRNIAGALGASAWDRRMVNEYHAAWNAPSWASRWRTVLSLWVLEAGHNLWQVWGLLKSPAHLCVPMLTSVWQA